MENICERFPVITQMILNNVDDRSLINFKETSRDNDEMLKSERFYWIRIVKKYNGNFQEFHESWLKVINKSPVEIVKELSLAVYQFFMAREARSEKQWHPLSICPAQGSFLLCEHIFKKTLASSFGYS